MSHVDPLRISDPVRSSFDPIIAAIGPVRAALTGVNAVAAVRPGFFMPPTGAPQPAVVVALMPATPEGTVDAQDLSARFGVRVSLVDATPEEQMAALERLAAARAVGIVRPPAPSAMERLLRQREAPNEYALPKTGGYQPLVPPTLPLVDETMKVTICVSPEAGWAELEKFLAATGERLTIAMYQFTARHIFDAIRSAVTPPGRTLELVLHPVPEPPAKSGIKANDLKEQDIIEQLQSALGDRFKMSWATLISDEHPDGLWASAYHIKVAVRDGRAVWLSSGNWQSSNQPPVHVFGDQPEAPFPGLQSRYNREYHAIIENPTLAAAYETYIRRDYEQTHAQGAPRASTLPDLLVQEEAERAVPFGVAPPKYFPPLELERAVKVQALLTPDNYAANALALIQTAKSSVWFQNQYINFRNNGEDFPEFRALIGALKAKIDEGLDVRIICRDVMKPESLDVLLALGFPREAIRFQATCHNKAIIVDRQVAMLGSHNWSNEGVKTNRDASLIFYDEEIAGYLAGVYEYDWERRARVRPVRKQPVVAAANEPAPAGFTRMAYTEVYED